MDTLTMIKNKENELSEYYERCDETRDKLYNKAYTLKGVDGKDLKKAISVTLPYGGLIANTIINDIMEAELQTVVKGHVTPRKAGVVEQFLKDSRAQADEDLTNKGQPTLHEFWSNHVCVRSYIGCEYISWFNSKGELCNKLLPLDMRWTPWQWGGSTGQAWVAPTFFRSGADILQEYPEAKGKVDEQAKNVKLRNFWSETKHEVYIADSLILEESNPYGRPPFVIAAPATGFMLRDEGYLKYESEDILFIVKHIIDEVNRSMSIETTVGMYSIVPPYEDIVPQGMKDASPAENPPGLQEVAKREKGYEFKLTERPDLNNAFVTGRADLLRFMQMAGVNDIDLGNVSQTVSAVWITAQSGIRKKFSNPRLKAIARAEAQLSRLMIDQFIRLNDRKQKKINEFVVGQLGDKTRFDAADLGDPGNYKIEHTLMSSDALLEIANLAQFEASKDLPLRYRLEHILKVQDVDEVMRQMTLQKEEDGNPAVFLLNRALKYAEEAEDISDSVEADVMRLHAWQIFQQWEAVVRAGGQPQTPQPEGGGNGSNMLASLPKLLNTPVRTTGGREVSAG